MRIIPAQQARHQLLPPCTALAAHIELFYVVVFRNCQQLGTCGTVLELIGGGLPQLPSPTSAMVSTEIPPGNHRGARDQMDTKNIQKPLGIMAEMRKCLEMQGFNRNSPTKTWHQRDLGITHAPASGGGLTSNGKGLVFWGKSPGNHGFSHEI